VRKCACVRACCTEHSARLISLAEGGEQYKPAGGVRHGKGPHPSNHRIDSGAICGLRDLERTPKDGVAAYCLDGGALEVGCNLPRSYPPAGRAGLKAKK
jgi:hypothetical protein